jgi:hypothetical protein
MPSRLADDAELRTLVSSLKEAGHGLFMLTKGGHTRMSFLEELAAESTRPVVVAALLHSSTNPEAVFHDLDAIAQANARGRRLVGAVRAARSRWTSPCARPTPSRGWNRGSRRSR